MTTPPRLLELTLREGPDAPAAVDDLLELPEAGSLLVGAIAAGGEARVAWALLPLLTSVDFTELLGPLARSDDRQTRSRAITALGKTGDPRVVDLLADVHRRYGNVHLVVDALGNLDCPRADELLRTILAARVGDLASDGALAELCTRAVEERDPTDLLVVAEVAGSLAKHGDFGLVAQARSLARFIPDPVLEFHQAILLRMSAVEALDVAVGPGVLKTLLEAAADSELEVADAAISATLHAGRAHLADTWVQRFAASDELVRSALHDALADFAGEQPPQEPSELLPWWEQRRARFAPELCYRLGEPASPAPLIARARGAHGQDARLELRQMTGLAFIAVGLAHAPALEIRRIDAWWSAHHHRFAPGKLHRWGRTYEPTALD